jgi:phage tail sheath protein FI
MPAALTYPGVYVEEISSGVRTITGVATSVVAFVGKAPRGPVNLATEITSYAEFERVFGGAVLGYPMGFMVRDFYVNGGVQAIIVRTLKGAKAATAANVAIGDFKLDAFAKGKWGNDLRVRVDQDDITDAVAAGVYPGATKADFYNVQIRDMNTGVTESYSMVTKLDKPRRADRMLSGSSLVKFTGEATKIPSDFGDPPDAGKTIWEDDDSSTKFTAGNADDAADVWSAENEGSEVDETGIYALGRVDIFNLLSLAPDVEGGDVPKEIWPKALAYCSKKRAMLLVDSPSGWKSAADAKAHLGDVGLTSELAKNAALYFPRINAPNPARGNIVEPFVASGMVAGVMARTDVSRGVWKAPAGIDAGLVGAVSLTVQLNDEENGKLNPLGINCLRTFPIVGNVIWGARTARGADLLASEWKYVPVRRLALFLEESLYRGLQWAVFEPNDEPLWAQIRLNVGAFMHQLFRQGAFQGGSPRDAYFVKCDKDTTTQNDINLGIVNVLVGFAPLKPAEFVVLKIQQMAGQIQT